MTQKRVLVTGAGGFIGRFVVQELLDNGYSVRATDLPRSDGRSLVKQGAEFVSSDLLDPESLERVMQGIQKVIHMAACFDFNATRPQAFAVNVTGTENLCRAALEAGVDRFVHLSTAGVHGIPEKIPVKEDDPKFPLENEYVLTKWWGEKVAWRFHGKHGLPVTVLRPALVYGPGSKYLGSFFLGLGALSLSLRQKRLYLVRGGVACSWIHVEDVAGIAAFLLDAEDAVGRAFNGADGRPVTSEMLCRAIAQAFGKGYVPLFRYPKRLMRMIARFMDRMPEAALRRLNARLQRKWDRIVLEYDLEPVLVPWVGRGTNDYALWDMVFSNQAILDLGYRFRHPRFEEAFPEVVRWYKENRWIPDV